jgi:hypothetical protein
MMMKQIELWEHSLALLNDEVYLDLVRNFLGKVPTPFHKPLLNKRMTTLFSSEEFVERVIQSLSELDRKILTSAFLLESPTQRELCSLYEDTIDYVTLQQNVVNLEERLLLVPHPNSQIKGGELMINPLLKDRLLESALSLEELIPPVAEEEKRLTFGDGQRSIIRGLLSLHFHDLLTTEERSARALQNRLVKSIFDVEQTALILNYNRLLFFTNAVKERERTSVVIHKQAFNLLALSHFEIQQLLFQSTWHANEALSKKVIPPTLPNAFYTSLNQIVEECTITNREQLLFVSRLVALKHRLEVSDWEQLIDLLYSIGLTTREPLTTENGESGHLKPTIDTDLTLSFSDDLELAAGRVDLYMLGVIKRFDLVNSYELNKKSLLKAFDSGLTTGEILTYLEKLTTTIPQTLRDLLGEWKQEYSAITIYDGIVVKADERLSRIIEALPNLQDFLITKIETGIYLFRREEEPQWREVLSSTGIGLLPSSIGAKEEEVAPISEPLKVEESSIDSLTHALKQLPKSVPPLPVTEDFKEPLLALAKKRGSSQGEREELEARIEQKLILLPSQVVNIERHSKTMEASGFDFQGKVNLCKTTLNSPLDLLELHLLDDEGNSRTILSEVKEIISGSTSQETSVRVSVLPTNEEKVIPIAKVFRVRKLRRSIFFQG